MNPHLKQLRQDINNFKKRILNDIQYLIMWEEKLAEIEEEEKAVKREIDECLKKRIGVDSNRQFWIDWVIERRMDDLTEFTKAKVKWQTYIRIAKGKQDYASIDKEHAKTVPLGSIIPYEPKYTSQKRNGYVCPFHEEKDASFVWSNEDNTGYCFGCNKYVDSISLIMELHGINFKDALSMLNKM